MFSVFSFRGPQPARIGPSAAALPSCMHVMVQQSTLPGSNTQTGTLTQILMHKLQSNRIPSACVSSALARSRKRSATTCMARSDASACNFAFLAAPYCTPKRQKSKLRGSGCGSNTCGSLNASSAVASTWNSLIDNSELHLLQGGNFFMKRASLRTCKASHNSTKQQQELGKTWDCQTCVA